MLQRGILVRALSVAVMIGVGLVAPSTSSAAFQFDKHKSGHASGHGPACAPRTHIAAMRATRVRRCGRTEPARGHAARSRSGARVRDSFGRGLFGMTAGGVLQNEDSATLARDLSVDQAAGSRWLRVDINWAQIQVGGSSSFNWGPIDAVVQGAQARGMNVLGLIVYSPDWARPAGTGASYSPNPGMYATFAGAAVRHYAALGVHAYEVWNEPNLVASWQPAPNPVAYTQLLKAAYPAIKAADPSATVVTGGLAAGVTNGTDYSPVDFLQAMYANGAHGSLDAVGIHPYCWPAYPGDAQSWSSWYQMYGTPTSLRSLMVANGDGSKLIWGTEFGAPTNGPSGSYVSESVQADMLTKAYQLWKGYSWAGPLFFYQGRDLGTDLSTRENFFGITRYDFSLKPAYTAYQSATAGL